MHSERRAGARYHDRACLLCCLPPDKVAVGSDFAEVTFLFLDAWQFRVRCLNREIYLEHAMLSFQDAFPWLPADISDGGAIFAHSVLCTKQPVTGNDARQHSLKSNQNEIDLKLTPRVAQKENSRKIPTFSIIRY